MESIIIFTNTRIVKRKGYGPFNIGIKQVTELVPINDNRQFIIVYDKIVEDNLQVIVNIVGTEAVYILYHSSPEETTIKKLKNEILEQGLNRDSVFSKESDHSNEPTYGRLKEIYDNKQNEKELEKVFNELKAEIAGNPKLKEKYNKLHALLTPSNAKNYNGNGEELKKLKEAAKNAKSPMDDEYVEALRNLKEKWLPDDE